MDLSIIIVNWNVKHLLEKCLESIWREEKDLSLEVIVVDNASEDNSRDFLSDLQQKKSSLKAIFNQKNFGFARATNQGIKIAKGNFVLLLNPDTELMPCSLKLSLERIKKDSNIGILGCQILNPDQSIQPSIRRFPQPLTILLTFLKLPKFFKFKSVDRYLAKDFDYHVEQAVDQVMGAFMLIRREVLNKIGFFDERFFIWFEEVDFCYRAQQAGYQTIYFPGARIIHYGGVSFSQKGLFKKQWWFFRSAWLYFKKHSI